MGVKRCIACDKKSSHHARSFFKVPLKLEFRKQWVENLKIKRPLRENTFVCEDHFDPKDILPATAASTEISNLDGEIFIKKVSKYIIDYSPVKINRQRRSLYRTFCSPWIIKNK